MKTASILALSLLAFTTAAQATERQDANARACRHYLDTGAQPAGEVKCDLSRDKPEGSLLMLGGSTPVHVYRVQHGHTLRYAGESDGAPKTDK